MSMFENKWMKVSLWSIKKATWLVWISLLGIGIVAGIGLALYMHSLPALSIWHTTTLKNDFTRNSNVKTFSDYLKMEDTLFRELDAKIYDKIPSKEKNRINRYTRGAYADPERWKQNWNRSFELPVKDPKMGVLLLHGMSDSPYSLHAQAVLLHQKGVWVVAMRMPGHGTIPSGLIKLRWEDMAAAVKIGMQRLKEKVGSKPVHIIGYSTGATLALNYTFDALNDETLTLPKSLIFYSPAVGLSAAAPFAIWQSRIAHILGLKKMEWNAIEPEYDPFKYNSFAVNAGDQVYQLTEEVQKQFDTYEKANDHTKPFPSVLSFSSITDATVSVQAVVDGLYERLPKGAHTLVLFDFNHHFSNNLLVKNSVLKRTEKLRKHKKSENYTLELISNMQNKDNNLSLIINQKVVKELPLQWDKTLYSLSHVSMPISPYDPLYGSKKAPKSPGIMLGHIAMYGETATLEISASAMLRQRWNPFHAYIDQRILKFMKLQ